MQGIDITTLIAFSIASIGGSQNAQLATDTPQSGVCSAKSAKPVSFQYVEKYADTRRNECIRITGYIRGQTLHQTRKIAVGNQEPDWRSIGLDLDWENTTLPMPSRPMLYTVIGTMRDCGNDSFPHYCHYVGGRIIAVTDIRAQRGARP